MILKSLPPSQYSAVDSLPLNSHFCRYASCATIPSYRVPSLDLQSKYARNLRHIISLHYHTHHMCMERHPSRHPSVQTYFYEAAMVETILVLHWRICTRYDALPCGSSETHCFISPEFREFLVLKAPCLRRGKFIIHSG